MGTAVNLLHQPGSDAAADSLANPKLVYTANGNLEAHSLAIWLRSNGVRAYAVEDHSGVSLFAFGTLSQFHKPQVFVDEVDLPVAAGLLREFESQEDRKAKKKGDRPPIQSECEECGSTSEFPASQDGTTQNCPKCNAYMDVGNMDWPEDFDVGSEDDIESPLETDFEALDSASQLDKCGDWQEAIAAYQVIAIRWPEHVDYVANCIETIQRKIEAAS